MKKIISIIILICITTNAYSQDSLARTIVSMDRGEDIVTHIGFLQEHSANPKEEISAYVKFLQPAIPIENISLYYLTRFQMSCEAKEPQNILFYAKIYLALSQEEELATIYTTAAKAATAIGDDSLAQWYLTKLKTYSDENEGWYEEEVSALSAEIHDIQKERTIMKRWSNWNEGVKGIWISDFYDFRPFPTVIIIDDPANSYGATLILENTKTRLKKVNGRWTVKVIPKEINTSQSIQFDGPNRAISLQFASKKIRDRAGLERLSKAGLDASRGFRTEANSYIRTSGESAKKIFTESLIVSATADLADNMFKGLTISSRKEEFHSFSMAAAKENMMESEKFYSYLKIYSDGRNRIDTGRVKSKFYRCEAEDSVFIILNNGSLFFTGSIESDSPVLKEYKRIKRFNSFLKPRFLIPAIITVGASGKLIYESFCDMNRNDSFTVRNYGMLMIGAVCIIAIPIIIFRESGKGVEKGVNKVLYSDFNQRHLKSLRRKKQVSLSFAPSFNPEYNLFSSSINVSF